MNPRRLARAREYAERTVSPEEARAYLEAPISSVESAEIIALAQWFSRRYPTGAERLAYVRRAYSRWRRGPPLT